MKERLAHARFSTPTPVQAAAIPQALEGKDVLATAQTGTGKTLAFLIPVIEQLLKSKTTGIAALVLVPTRELAMQVVAQFNGLRGTQLVPAGRGWRIGEGAQANAIRKGARVVVATLAAWRITWIANFSISIRCASWSSTKRTACWT